MSYILNIETATKNCSVAIAKDGKTLICKEIATENYSHAEKLHVFIAESLKDINLTFKDLSAVAVSKGPGSYTGLRIGVSAAKGFCFALNIPLIGVDTLKVLAKQVKVTEGVIVPMLDARRMEVYSAIFDPQLQPVREVRAEIITQDSLSQIEGKINIIGDCQSKVREVLQKGNVVYHEDTVYPSANDMAILSFEKFRDRDIEDVAYFEPLYLKDFIAGKS